jgi:hypothetical protein
MPDGEFTVLGGARRVLWRVSVLLDARVDETSSIVKVGDPGSAE